MKSQNKAEPKIVPTTLITNIAKVSVGTQILLPFFSSTVSAGFPSPADDFLEGSIDLNQFLIDNVAATFLVRVQGESMLGAGIFPRDILIIDRSKNPKSGQVILAILNGEFLLKRYKKNDLGVLLESANPDYANVQVVEGDDFQIWGVVKYVIHDPN